MMIPCGLKHVVMLSVTMSYKYLRKKLCSLSVERCESAIDGARNGQHRCYCSLKTGTASSVLSTVCSGLFLLILINTRYDGQSPSMR